MTRHFSSDGVPGDDVASYYALRAQAGNGFVFMRIQAKTNDWKPNVSQ